MSQSNFFGHLVRSPLTIARDRAMRPPLKAALGAIFRTLTADAQAAVEAERTVWALAERAQSEREVERAAFEVLTSEFGMTGQLRSHLEERARVIVGQVSRWHPGGRLLDFGCGDGLIGQALAGSCDVTLFDIVDYRDRGIDLPFLQGREGDPLTVTEGFDTVLLLTVLHHSNDPLSVLREVRRLCTGRVIVIESVFGVSSRTGWNEPTHGYLALSEREQCDFNTFFDWFYNRVLHQDVPVPLNFQRPYDWITVFRGAGFEVLGFEHLGVDQVLVPEFHVLYWLA